MSPEESFLHAVLEAPDDDTPRLVYADWLDDHGEHDRAEFIRVRIDLARLAPGQDVASRLGYVEGGTLSTSNRTACALALARSTSLAALTEVILRGNTSGPEGVEALRQRFGDGLFP